MKQKAYTKKQNAFLTFTYKLYHNTTCQCSHRNLLSLPCTKIVMGSFFFKKDPLYSILWQQILCKDFVDITMGISNGSLGIASVGQKDFGPVVGPNPKAPVIKLAEPVSRVPYGLSNLRSSSGTAELGSSTFIKETIPAPGQSTLVQKAPASVTVEQTSPARALATTSGKQAMFCVGSLSALCELTSPTVLRPQTATEGVLIS